MDEITITIFNLRITELSTFISDILLGLSCFVFYRYIKTPGNDKKHSHFANFFLFMSLSATIAAFAHALFLYTGKSLQYIGWLMSGFAVYFIEMGFFYDLSEEWKKNLLSRISKGRLFIISLLSIIYMDFAFIIINTIIGLILIVSPILVVNYFNQGSKNNLFILGGILLALVPAILHSLQIKLYSWLPMKDFNHYFLIVCFYLMFLGIKGLIAEELNLQTEKI